VGLAPAVTMPDKVSKKMKDAMERMYVFSEGTRTGDVVVLLFGASRMSLGGGWRMGIGGLLESVLFMG
jgi:hypothetical protein